MKKEYRNIDIQVVRFDTLDVIITSSNVNTNIPSQGSSLPPDIDELD